MKRCGYCGRENLDQSDRCCECGTTLPEHAVETPKSETENHAFLAWLGRSVFYTGTFIVIALLYLLSFGPVDRYCNKVVTRTSAPATLSSNAYTSGITMISVRYPLWVGMLYRPALYLRARSDLYRRYVALWNRGDDLI
jgi:hypothetical protein